MPKALLPVVLTLAMACGGAPGDPAPASDPPRPGPGGACMGTDLLASLGKDHLLVGLSGTDAAADAAPYDLRSLYIAGGIPDGPGPCARCDAACTATDHSVDPPRDSSCDNAHGGCAWWGCWQGDQVAPGDYARGFVAKAKAAGPGPQVPMLTYYELLQSMPGVSWKGNEGDAEVKQVADAAFMSRYYADWRFLLKQIGNELAFLHVEPDFWGYAAQRLLACSAIPAAVASANATDCAGLPNTLSGMGQCMIAMSRKYAPNAKVGLHASGWGTRWDVLENRDTAFDVVGEARKLGDFLVACGAGEGDFIAADMSDRDAGTNGKWWDATNSSLPDFHQAFTWAGAVAEAVGLPLLWWQTPVGNMSLPTANRDNRVDYVLGHMSELASSHSVGIAFGAGAGGQASPDDDGGNLASKTSAYAAAGGVSICR